ncbi:prolyl oligopeptidase family serine peptidase [Leptospira sp. 201903070]|uniref:Prolyl oligopeptidase family serine peptidase n=1 Tax=Leptospira ainlahdjerensis TaxID=2810033 RepID=A0ABS2U6G2_9LEPT|nr:prolyl oligopeptidase family serine peptidase [Leptospira ainlahdjerensis]MBM9575958.1 prolyl oligopeptidase family serine peptidase [Leptospira ainlahdjerensis]
MKSKEYLKFIILSLFFISASTQCRLLRNLRPVSEDGSKLEKLTIDGIERTYWIHLPEKKLSPGDKLPLVLGLHGRLGSGKNIMDDSKLNLVSDREGFIVVYPDGIDRSWADGRGATPADKQKIDDVRFLEKLIDHISEIYPIAKEKIFIFGHSNGGFMTQRMLIEKTKRFRAGVSVSSQISEFILRNFEPSANVSVAFINGTKDGIVPYYGGYVRDGGEILSVEDSVDRWLQWNSCFKEPEIKKKDEKEDGTSVEIYSYNPCKGKTSVRLYKIVDGGHNWPGVNRRVPFIKMGNPTYELDPAEEIWSFFKTELKSETGN